MLDLMAIEQLTTPTGAILYDSERIGKPSESFFDADYWRTQRRVVAQAGGRGGVMFVRHDGQEWVLRHYRRGGLVGKLISDSYLWLGSERTRAFREWRLLHALHAQGLPVPVPVATRYQRNGWLYRADLLTAALPPSRTLAESMTGAVLDQAAWSAIGTAIARFHAAGVHHADLNAHNILLGGQGRVWLLDFDRGRIRPRGAWEQSVLARLRRSLEKIKSQRANAEFDERQWGALLAGYGTTGKRDDS
ncbi:MAG TPA: 3-deoxy-D-manno-octulosonic acid kinase [Steroidobacteraceae bacterium]|nr:3-deoxy-D-manno-octulosonic acid kinase [Steroidobacteraceae bacterium]